MVEWVSAAEQRAASGRFMRKMRGKVVLERRAAKRLPDTNPTVLNLGTKA